jgi:hypothetical protein
MKQLYYCDPALNVQCGKTACKICPQLGRLLNECEATSNPEYAIRDERGEPVKYPPWRWTP